MTDLTASSLISSAEIGRVGISSLEHELHNLATDPNSGVTKVEMNAEPTTIRVSSAEDRVMFSSGFGGCISTFLVSISPAGDAVATMNHFGPLQSRVQIGQLENQYTNQHSPLGVEWHRFGLIFLPESLRGHWDLKFGYSEHPGLVGFTDLIGRVFGNSCPVQVIRYPSIGAPNGGFSLIYNWDKAKPACVECEMPGVLATSIMLSY